LEKGIVPLHIHVEAAITKGKYDDYDTFLAAQAVQYVRLYLEGRRQGNLHHEIPAEEISDDSPLIRDEMYTLPRPSSEAINLVVFELQWSLFQNAYGFPEIIQQEPATC
jgi:hypothetical protein